VTPRLDGRVLVPCAGSATLAIPSAHVVARLLVSSCTQFAQEGDRIDQLLRREGLRRGCGPTLWRRPDGRNGLEVWVPVVAVPRRQSGRRPLCR
jgi:hypothetical protein